MPDLLIADIAIIFFGPVRRLGRCQDIPGNRQEPTNCRVLRPGRRAFLHMDVKRGADRGIDCTRFRDPKRSMPFPDAFLRLPLLL